MKKIGGLIMQRKELVSITMALVLSVLVAGTLTACNTEETPLETVATKVQEEAPADTFKEVPDTEVATEVEGTEEPVEETTEESTEKPTQEVPEDSNSNGVSTEEVFIPYQRYTNRSANIRAGADKTTELVGTAKINTEVTVIGVEGDWSKVSYNGMEAFIKSSLLSENVTEVTQDTSSKTSSKGSADSANSGDNKPNPATPAPPSGRGNAAAGDPVPASESQTIEDIPSIEVTTEKNPLTNLGGGR